MKRHIKDFNRFSLNEGRFSWSPDHETYMIDGEPVETPYGHCFGGFAYGELEIYSFDAAEIGEWLNDTIAELWSSGSGEPSDEDYNGFIVRAMDLDELLSTVGDERFREFIATNSGKWG